MSGRRRISVTFAAACAVALVVASCSNSLSGKLVRPEVPTSTAAADDGTKVEQTVDKVRVRATVSPADAAHGLTIAEAGDAPKLAEAEVASTPRVSIQLGQGRAQPRDPMQLSFDLSERPDLARQISDTVRPAIQSESETDPEQRDLFIGQWDPATATVTASVTHLSRFRLSFIDIAKAITRIPKFDQLRGDTKSPCRESSSRKIGGTAYTLTALDPGAVAGCLVDDKGSVAVDFDNATGAFYAVRLAPKELEGSWRNNGAMGTSESAGMLAAFAPNSVGTLAGRSKGRLTLSENISEAEIRLHPQPQAILAQSLNSAVSMFGVSSAVLDTVAGAWDCFATGYSIPDGKTYESVASTTNMVNGVGQCLIAAGTASAGNAYLKEALHRLATGYNLLFNVPQQLWDFFATGMQEIAHESERAFHLVAEKEPEPTPTETAEPAGPVVERLEMSTWAYDRVEGSTYVADNIGKKKVAIYWKSFQGDKQVRPYPCTSKLTISGPGLTQSEELRGCDSYNPGTYVLLPRPGTYVATVEATQQGMPPVVAHHEIVILPN